MEHVELSVVEVHVGLKPNATARALGGGLTSRAHCHGRQIALDTLRSNPARTASTQALLFFAVAAKSIEAGAEVHEMLTKLGSCPCLKPLQPGVLLLLRFAAGLASTS